MSEKFTVLAQKAALEINTHEAAELARHMERIKEFVSILSKIDMPAGVEQESPTAAAHNLAEDKVTGYRQAFAIEKFRFAIPPLLGGRK